MEVLCLLLASILPIIVCAMICENKGRTTWKGVVAGAFLGWIGVIICVCLDNRKQL